MIVLYLITLFASASVVGLFAQQLAADQGYSLGLEVGMQMAAAGALAYAASQLAFMTVVGLLKPAKGRLWLFFEIISHLASVLLLPYLMKMRIDTEIPEPELVIALACLAAFGVVHTALKLISFFTALQSTPGNRYLGLFWSVCTAGAAAGCATAFAGWLEAVEAARPQASDAAAVYRIEGAYREARRIPEGSYVIKDIDPREDRRLALYWALPPDSESALGKIYVTTTLEGEVTKTEVTAVTLDGPGWRGIHIAAGEMPPNCRRCMVTWSTERIPSWRRLTGLTPVIRSNREVLLGGPQALIERTETDDVSDPNVVIVGVDGLGYEHMSRGGYHRKTTQQLDRFAFSSMAFSYAYTPAPEASAAYMSLLTGVMPLRHGYLGQHQGPLPAQFQTLAEIFQAQEYATAAFTEGEAREDLMAGTGFERGFDLFDAAYGPAGTSGAGGGGSETSWSAGSRSTLERAARWIAEHREARFFAFVRVSELMELKLHDRYGTPFIEEGKNTPAIRDTYDTALRYLDQQIARFVASIRDYETRRNTLIVICSPFTLDFTAGPGRMPRLGLSETALRVPIFMYAYWLENEARSDLVRLEDAAPSILSQTNALFSAVIDGENFLPGPNGAMPVSVLGDPLEMTMRSGRYRHWWPTGRSPFKPGKADFDAPGLLYDMRYYRPTGKNWDQSSKHPDRIRRWRFRLESLLEQHDRIWSKMGTAY